MTDPADLRIRVGSRDLLANWTGENAATRAAVAGALPVGGDAIRWGEELYFEAGVDAPKGGETRTAVPVGAVAYWPPGDVLCLFWGPTPASREDEPRAASPVAVVARLRDVGPLSEIDGGAHVHIEAVDAGGAE